MTAEPKTRRIRWKVRASPRGFLPVVLIGEVPIVGEACATKRAAREQAKAKAKTVRGEKYD